MLSMFFSIKVGPEVVDTYFWMTKDPQPGSGKYGPHTCCSGHACTAFIFLNAIVFLSLKGWTGGVYSG